MHLSVLVSFVMVAVVAATQEKKPYRNATQQTSTGQPSYHIKLPPTIPCTASTPSHTIEPEDSKNHDEDCAELKNCVPIPMRSVIPSSSSSNPDAIVIFATPIYTTTISNPSPKPDPETTTLKSSPSLKKNLYSFKTIVKTIVTHSTPIVSATKLASVTPTSTPLSSAVGADAAFSSSSPALVKPFTLHTSPTIPPQAQTTQL